MLFTWATRELNPKCNDVSFQKLTPKIMGLNGLVPAGVVTGDNLIKLMDYCKKNGHALPGKLLLI